MSQNDVHMQGGWKIAARPVGEVLAAQAERRGLSVTVFLRSRSRTPREVEGRLLDIIDGAAVAASGDAGPRAIPAILHHTLDGLLRWREELARRAEGDPFHLFAAWGDSGGMISVACVSGPEPDVVLDGEAFQPPWRTAIERGDFEARAFSIYAGRVDEARVSWSGGSSAPGSGGGVVEAAWRREATAPAAFANEEERPGLAPDPSGIATLGVQDEPEVQDGPEEEASVAPAVDDVAVAEAGTEVREKSEAAEIEAAIAAAEAAAGIALTPVSESAGGVGTIEIRGVASEATVPAAAWGVSRGPQVVPPAPEAPRRDPAFEPATPFLPDEDASFMVDEGIGNKAEAPAPALPDDAPPFLTDDGMMEPATDAAATAERETVTDEAAATEAVADEMTAEAAPADGSATPGGAVSESMAGVEPAPVPRFSPLRPAWPDPEEMERPRRLRRLIPWAIGVIVLFAIGWLVGTTGQGGGKTQSGWTRALRAVGLGGAWFDATVTSKPAGAWISVDGKELALRTPATFELKPGAHKVTLAMDGLGGATFDVRGEQDEKVPLDVSLLGSLVVRSTDPDVPIQVSVDGTTRGYAPMVVTGLEPGTHTVEYSGPGMTPWGTTVEVRVAQEAQTLARPFESPATGVIEVQAFGTGDGGPEEIDGAPVRVDGRAAGYTPLTLELDRGPHSISVRQGGVTAPVQVIELPGGNQRYAKFSFGVDAESPQLTFITSTGPMPSDKPFPVSASLQGVTAHEVREMWLHVGAQDGMWRRYPMAMLEASGGVVGTVVFPAALLDAKGRAPYYASAMMATGDEYFTEIQNPPKSHTFKKLSTNSSDSRTR